MSVPARNNGHGVYSYKEDCVQTTLSTKPDGTVISSQRAWTQVSHECRRSVKIKARYVLTSSFQVLFRTPTTYDRGVRQFRSISGVWEQSIVGGVYTHISQEGPPDTQANGRMVACAPLMTSSLVSIDINQRNRARTECLLKLKDAKASAGESLGEAGSTVRLLASRARDLAFAANAARTGQWGSIPKAMKFRFGRAARSPRNVSNLYLEVQYGWLPLMKEVHGLYELAHDQTRKGLMLRASREVFDNQSFDQKVIEPGWETSANGRRSHKCVIYGIIDNAKVRNFNRTGVLSPSTPWQLVRLSFVIDWLIPIGNFLDALTANWGVEFLGGFDSQWCEYSATAVKLPSGNYKEVTPKSYECDAFSFRRQRLTSFPAPVPYIKSPFSGQHAASAIALIHSLAFK